jgi:hypothetical protein
MAWGCDGWMLRTKKKKRVKWNSWMKKRPWERRAR